MDIAILTPEQIKQIVAEAVKAGIELYVETLKTEEEKAAGRMICLKDLAAKNGYKGTEQYIKIAKKKRIELTGKPYMIESRHISEFPKKVLIK